MYKGHMDKAKGDRIEGGRSGGQGKVVAGKWRQLFLNNNFKKAKKTPTISLWKKKELLIGNYEIVMGM